LGLAKGLPGLISTRDLKRFIEKGDQQSGLRALAAAALAQFPAETTFMLWKELPLDRYPECLSAALVSVAQIDPRAALRMTRFATDRTTSGSGTLS
jgi:hypothetical protein